MEDQSLPLYGKGANVRDWLYVVDNCRAVDLLIRGGQVGQVYNIGAGNEVQNIHLAERICDLLGKPRSLITPVRDRLGHDRRYALNCRKIRALGWRPETPFDEGLAATVHWYGEHEEWWHKIRGQSREFRSFYDIYYKERK